MLQLIVSLLAPIFLAAPQIQGLGDISAQLEQLPIDQSRPVVWLREDFENKRQNSVNAVIAVKVENVAAEQIPGVGKAMIQGAAATAGRKSYRFKIPKELRNNVLVRVLAKGKLSGDDSALSFSLRSFAKDAVYSKALHEEKLQNWQEERELVPIVEFRLPQLETTAAHKYDFEFDFRLLGKDATRAFLDEVLIVIAGAK